MGDKIELYTITVAGLAFDGARWESGEFGVVWWSKARSSRAVESASSGTCVEWSETKQPAASSANGWWGRSYVKVKVNETIFQGAAENNPQLIQMRQRSGLLL